MYAGQASAHDDHARSGRRAVDGARVGGAGVGGGAAAVVTAGGEQAGRSYQAQGAEAVLHEVAALDAGLVPGALEVGRAHGVGGAALAVAQDLGRDAT